MDYKELVNKLRNNNREDNCHDCALGYYAFGAATAITDLLSRAEAAEARAEKVERERDGFKQRYIEMTNRACELSKIVDEHGLEE